jgi:membrane-associated phospholipid phosphatase
VQSTKSFLRSYFKKLPLGLLVLLASFAGALFLFALVVHEVLWEKEEVVDQSSFDFLSTHVITDGLTRIMKVTTYFASATFLQIAYSVLFILYLIIKNLKRAVEIAAIGIGGFIINYFMKLAFHRTRPAAPLISPLQNFSFPSGHATSGFIFYGLLAYLVWKTRIGKPYKIIFGVILILFSMLIGFSRVYLRVHYPSDVLAGFCIGFAWLLLAIYLLESLKKKTDIEEQAKKTRVHQ